MPDKAITEYGMRSPSFRTHVLLGVGARAIVGYIAKSTTGDADLLIYSTL